MTIHVTAGQLAPILPALLGIAAAYLTELLTKLIAPAWVKRTVAGLLALLAGVIPTVTLHTGETAATYLVAILSAWVLAIATHTAGLTTWLQSATAGFGLGPALPTIPANGTPGLTAGSTTALPAAPTPAPGPAAAPVVIVGQAEQPAPTVQPPAGQ